MMKIKIIFTFLLLGLIMTSQGQTRDSWSDWKWLMGEWVGEGDGTPGKGGGIFSFSLDLDQNILVRKSHSEYPATANKPLVIHNDLMIVYPDSTGKPSKAIYFDNEGHVINYSIEVAEKKIVFTSDKISNMPVFRLVYELLDAGTVNTKFEMSQNGTDFMTYIEGKSSKK